MFLPQPDVRYRRLENLSTLGGGIGGLKNFWVYFRIRFRVMYVSLFLTSVELDESRKILRLTCVKQIVNDN